MGKDAGRNRPVGAGLSEGRPPSTPYVPRGNQGGPGATGGLNVQAALTAVALAAGAAGRPLQWWTSRPLVPVEVWAETHGPGDDIRLRFEDGRTAEIQVKKTTRQHEAVWTVVLKLARALHDGQIDFGLLAVTDAAAWVRKDLAQDIHRLSAGRQDDLSQPGLELLRRLREADLDPARACSGLAVESFSVTQGNMDAVRTAIVWLESVLENPADGLAAWQALETDAGRQMEWRGARDAASVARLLSDQGFRLTSREAGPPAALAAALCRWTLETSETFTIIGVPRPLSLAEVWIPLTCSVVAPGEGVVGLKEALNRYHAKPEDGRSTDLVTADAITLGRYYRHAVVTAGPGTGKSTLLKRLAGIYASEGRPVVRASLRTVAARMKATGATFEEAMFAMGLAGSPLAPSDAGRLGPWVLLCDGLDECGSLQADVAAGLTAYAAGHPQARLIVVTRPVGFQPAPFAGWRHYRLDHLDRSSVVPHAATLVDAIRGVPAQAPRKTYEEVAEKLSGKAADLAARSPLMLALSSALLAGGRSLTGGLADVYSQIVELIEAEETPRATGPVARVVRRHIAEMIGAAVIADPLRPAAEVEAECQADLMREQGSARLAAAEAAEAAISHLEALGVIERLRHDGKEIFTFVHKTLGEYYAASRLAGREPDARRKALTATVSAASEAPGARETLEFVVALGLGDETCEALLGRDGEPGRQDPVLLALELAARFDAEVSEGVRRRAIDLALQRMVGPDRASSIAAAKALMDVAPADPAFIGQRMAPLLAHAQDWTRMGAWAATIRAGKGTDIPYDVMKVEFQRVLEVMGKDADFVFGRGFLSIGPSLGDLVTPFVAFAAERLLEKETPEDAVHLIEAMLDNQLVGSFSLTRQLKALAQAFNVQIDLGKRYEPTDHSAWWGGASAYGAARVEALKILFSSIALPKDGPDAPDGETPIMVMDIWALWSLCRMDFKDLAEVRSWPRQGRAKSVALAVEAVARIAGLPLAGLAVQSRCLLDRLAEAGADARLVALPLRVDHPDIDFSKAAALGLDPHAFEPLLHHGAQEPVRLAASLIDGCGRPDDAFEIGQRALDMGKGWTPVHGAAVAREAKPQEALVPILSALRDPERAGRHLLILCLHDPRPAYTGDVEAALAACLHADRLTASEAARLALAYVEAGETSLGPVLEAADAAWADWEIQNPPEPGKGRVSGPREDLVKAILLLKPPSIDQLLRLSRDPAGEVSQIARVRLEARVDEDADVASALWQAYLQGQGGLGLLLKHPGALKPEWVEILLERLDSPSLQHRRDGLALLKSDVIPARDARRYATRMTTDADPHLREGAYALLRRLPNTGR